MLARLRRRKQGRESRKPRKGVILGFINENGVEYDIWVDSLGGATTIFGQPGCGKTSSLIVPTLYENPDESFWIFDPSGEIYCQTVKARSRTSQIRILCGWPEEVSEMLGVEVKDAGLNLYGSVDPLAKPETVKDEISMRTSLFLMADAKMNATNRFFQRTGQVLVSSFALLAFAKGETPSAATIASQLMASPDQILDRCAEMASYEDAFGGLLSHYGHSLAGVFTTAPEQAAASLSTAQIGLEIYDQYGPLGKHVSKEPGFDPRDMKKKEAMTGYIMMPNAYMGTHSAWLGTTVSFLMEYVGRDPRRRSVHFLLDEAGNMTGEPGKCAVPGLPRFIALYRKNHLKITLVFQDLGQLDCYGPAGKRSILSNSTTIVAMDTGDLETQKLLSEMLGKRASASMSRNRRQEMDGSYSISHESRDMLASSEIRTLGGDKNIIFHGQLNPFITTRTPFWEKPYWRVLGEGLNPYVED